MKKFWILAVLGSFIFAGVALYSVNRYKSQSKLFTIKRGQITEAIYALGTVVPRQKFSFKLGITKTIKHLYVVEGDAVKKGQKLILFDDGITVSSPLDGTVTSLPYKPGENAFADQPVVTVQNLKDVYLEARLDQQGALRVKKGMPTKITFESLRQQVFVGQIDSLFPSSGNFVARINISKLPEEILPGMTADVAIEVATKENILLIPILAISNGQVVVHTKNGKEKMSLQVGIRDNEWAEDLSGSLKEGDQIYLRDR